MDEIEECLQALPQVLEELLDVRDETLKHSQLATATENLKHIFMVPETVNQTEALITDGKLLEAHKVYRLKKKNLLRYLCSHPQSLVELENSRDELLFELHKLQPHQSTADKELLSEYFQSVSSLSDLMEKQIKFILRRTLNTVRKDPKVRPHNDVTMTLILRSNC